MTIQPIDASLYQSLERAFVYLLRHYSSAPSLPQLAEQAGMSQSQFETAWHRWVSPTLWQMVQPLLLTALKRELQQSAHLIATDRQAWFAASAGASHPELQVATMTPDEYQLHGHELTIGYGVTASPFGPLFIAITSQGICAVEFVDNDKEAIFQRIHHAWPQSVWVENQEAVESVGKQIFDPIASKELHLLLKGTPFQLKVWQTLLSIPRGSIVSYADVATLMQQPAATRAVASAVAQNPVACLVPCHRVIRREGVVGQYHWRTERKMVLLGWELSTSKCCTV